MKRIIAGMAAAALLGSSPVLARDPVPERPITDRDPDAKDVAMTPVTDLNVGRDGEIPPILAAAVSDPYTLEGLGKCTGLSAAVSDLDEVLGPDIDLPQVERERISGGRVAKWLVTSVIPFRGLIREVSGANEQDRKVNAAIQAGLTRRGFLKGVGAARHCKYPARPAPTAVVQARLDELGSEAAKRRSGSAKDRQKDDAKASDLAFKSEPDVRQPAPSP